MPWPLRTAAMACCMSASAKDAAVVSLRALAHNYATKKRSHPWETVKLLIHK